MSTNLRAAVEDFLYAEAELLDQWKLPEWAELFAPDGTYLVAPLGLDDPRHSDPDSTLFLVADTRTRISERVTRLMKKGAHAEYPHSRTRHAVNNVVIESSADGIVKVAANFITYRARNREVVSYMGRTYYTLAVEGESFRIQEKRVTLDLELLAPQGSLAIIL